MKFVPAGAGRVQLTRQQSRAAAASGEREGVCAFLQQSGVPRIGHSCPPRCAPAPLRSVPASSTSMPSASKSILIALNELTASTMNITSGYFLLSAAISASGLIVPVEVSLWTSVTVSNLPVARRRSNSL